jgi:hypothetical protein
MEINIRQLYPATHPMPDFIDHAYREDGRPCLEQEISNMWVKEFIKDAAVMMLKMAVVMALIVGAYSLFNYL